ncbi:MAG: response regulator, partial [Acidobacteriota bacterium]
MGVTSPASSGRSTGVPSVLVADHEPAVSAFLRRLLETEGYHVDTVPDGSSVLHALTASPPDLVILDATVRGTGAFDVCRRIRQDAATRLIPIIVVSTLGSRAERVESLEAGADDLLTKPVDTTELLARARSLVRMKRFTDDLDSASSIITTLAAMLETRDGYDTGHCHRMANYAASLGRALGISELDQQVLYRGGFLHDIGMLAIPEVVLKKEGPLAVEEFELIKSHTLVGESLCANLRSLQAVRPIVRSHHERLDGSG